MLALSSAEATGGERVMKSRTAGSKKEPTRRTASTGKKMIRKSNALPEDNDWKLPDGKALADFVLQAGGVAPLLLLSEHLNADRSETSQSKKKPSAGGEGSGEPAAVGGSPRRRTKGN